ncbi:MAG: glycosyltransferase [Solirubrobacterales bacterium]|nr:glycosyltransferase [Solirubrobacterales bacterium]
MARSRTALLDEIDVGADVTLVGGEGNRGDALIWAGARRLLEGRIYREVAARDLAGVRGELVLLPGGGAFSHAYHEFMPRILAIAERRFERVVVLPSSFDVRVEEVRRALDRTNATVFAREDVSFAAIQGLCRARAAHDCAFYYDFSGFAATGAGLLNAYRTDLEALPGPPLPADNDDISVTCPDLESWLARIAAHAVVRTDRAHVMIAAALMGRRVEWSPGASPKVAAFATGALAGYDIDARPRSGEQTEPSEPSERRALRRRLASSAAAPSVARSASAVTAVVLTRDRPGYVERCVASILADPLDVDVLLIDCGSTPAVRERLAVLAAGQEQIMLRLADRDLGCAGGRKLGTEHASGDYVLFLDDDAELLPGALAHLVAELDAHPDVAGVTSLVVGGDGRVQHFGGWIERGLDIATFTLAGSGCDPDDAALGSSGPTGWVPGTASLLRAEALAAFPIDIGMAAYYEDNDWCLRVAAARPGAFRRCREAVVIHHSVGRPGHHSPFSHASRIGELVATFAHFHAVHGILLGVDLENQVPELRREDGTLDEAAARLLLGLVHANGTDWFVDEWQGGRLAPLFAAGEIGAVRREATARRAAYRDLEGHTSRVQAYLDELQAHAGRQEELLIHREREIARLEAETHALRERVGFLEVRQATLMRIEAGGWWRLRGQLRRLARPLRWVGRWR